MIDVEIIGLNKLLHFTQTAFLLLNALSQQSNKFKNINNQPVASINNTLIKNIKEIKEPSNVAIIS